MNAEQEENRQTTSEHLNTSRPVNTDSHLHNEEEEQKTQISIEDIQFWRQYRSIRKKYVSRQMRNFLEYFLTGLLSLLLLLTLKLTVHKDTEDAYNISFICGLNVWSLFYMSKFIRFIKMYPTILEAKKKLHMRKSIFQICLFLFCIVQISMYAAQSGGNVNKNFVNVYFVSLPLLLSLLINFLCHIESANSCFYFLKCIKMAISLFRLIFVFMIFLKLDAKVNISWNSALW
jgi:hypothetical protein